MGLSEAPIAKVGRLAKVKNGGGEKGAQGINTALDLFQWPRVATVLLTVLAVVVAIEIIVTQIRKRIP